MITRHPIKSPSSPSLRTLPDPATSGRVALVGNHIPRRCGIATFTTDLATWLEINGCDVDVYAMSESSGKYLYPDRVVREVPATNVAAYRQAARDIDQGGYDAVCLQHEYGIFGGECGEHILGLLENLRTPVVTTLHTILDRPNHAQRRVMARIVERSRRLVVMSDCGKEILERMHPSSRGKTLVIPHGVPSASQCDRKLARQKLGLEGRNVILTFGLLSRDKGIDQMILAMDEVRRKDSDALYSIVGATHPHVIDHEGEVYRESLEHLVKEHGLEDHVRFVNEFVPLESLVDWLVSCDVYVCPYLKVEQVTSGTLSYAYGLGKPVVSTPNWHAQELLANGRGVLVPPSNPDALAKAVLQELSTLGEWRRHDPTIASMHWDNVANRYMETFHSVLRQEPTLVGCQRTATDRLPTSHLAALTDDVGIVQHAMFSFPRREEGYCTDDNARALILTVDAHDLMDEDLRGKMESRYLAFVSHAFDQTRRTFHNFMSYDRRWLDEGGSQDCQGRAVWALGHVAKGSPSESHRAFARQWFQENIGLCGTLTSPRAVAYALLGLDELSKVVWDWNLAQVAADLARDFWSMHRRTKTEEWPWWEPVLAYDNARLPQAMFAAHRFLAEDGVKADALEALTWLCRIQTAKDGSFAPIGCHGFFRRGASRAWFDQQPIDATASVQACLTAFAETQDATWLFEARRAWEWFDGRNMVGTKLTTVGGACYDGLSESGVNLNQGAESTLSYLLAWAAMKASRGARGGNEIRAPYAV